MGRLVIKYLAFVAFVSLMAGCSVKNPSAATFMSVYHYNDDAGKKNGSGGAGVISFVGDDASKTKTELIPVDFHGSGYKKWSHFLYGLGFQTLSPYASAGFAWEYFGIMSWGNLAAPLLAGINYSSFYLDFFGGGGSIIEQIPISSTNRIGFSQFVARSVTVSPSTTSGTVLAIPGPQAYNEYGVTAFYVMDVDDDSENSKMVAYAIEARYSRDIDAHCNRYSVSLGFIGL